MPLLLMYITNDLEVALIAQKYGVNRIWIDLEALGKEERQRGLDAVKSHHSVNDIRIIKPRLSTSEMLVRVNPWNKGSIAEIDAVIDAGADIIMLPYWKTVDEVRKFVDAVNGRCKTTLLLETKEADNCIDDVLKMGGFDEIHIGLNDLHLSFGLTFMFELLVDGTVERLCQKFRDAGIPYGFGGVARLGYGDLPAEKVIEEHYRLGSSRAILSRSFCDVEKVSDVQEVDRLFGIEMEKLRRFESQLSLCSNAEFLSNHEEVKKLVAGIVKRKKGE